MGVGISRSIFHIREDQPAGRLELPDFLRGVAVLLVLLHHSGVPNGEWILAFHMPLLFVLSGYTEFLLGKERGFAAYLKNRVLRLLVPYFAFEAVNLGVWMMEQILQGGWQDLSEAGISILTCVNNSYEGYYGRLWFLPCMFVSDLYFYGIRRLSRGRRQVLWLSLPVMLAASWVSANLLPFRLPFTVDTAFFATAFLLGGYLLGGSIRTLLERKNRLKDMLVLAGAVAVMALCIGSGKSFCYMYLNRYGNYLLSVTAAVAGTAAFLVAAKWLYALTDKTGVGKHLILWYGNHSLATFPVHLSLKVWMFFHLPRVLWVWYYILAFMLVMNIPLVNLITKYLPFMLGKFPARKK